MRFYRHNKFALSLGFVVILALFAAVALVGLSRMSRIKASSDAIVNQQNVKIELVAAMHNAARERSISLHRMALMRDPFERDDEYLYFRQMAWDFIKARDALVTMPLSAAEHEALAQSQKLTQTASRVQDEIYTLIADEKLAEADHRLLTEAMPAQNRVLAQFTMLLDYQRKAAQSAARAADREYRRGLYTVIVLGLLSVGLGGAIAVAVVRHIGRAERALFNEKERAEVTLHSIADAVITTDAAGHIEYMNPIAEQLTGWSLTEARGQAVDRVFRVVEEQTRAPIPSLGARHLGAEAPAQNAQGVLVSRDGMEYAIEESAAPIRDGQGRVVGHVVVFHDVTHARHLAQQLSWQASHDALTGLANRREFEVVMGQMWESTRTLNKHHALLYIDLDQFKVVNDTCGHAAGDELLRQLSVVIGAKVREGDSLFRLGGDEFALLLSGCQMNRAAAIANDIRKTVEAFRFVWQDKTFALGVSIGLVPIDAESEGMAQILTAADAACYTAKEKGRNRVQVYAPADAELAMRKGEMQWLPRINRALEENRLQLYFQKIASVRGPGAGSMHVEILLRMRDEQGGLVLPQAFIPAAERYHLMPSIDRWVVRQVLQWAAAHVDRLKHVSTVYINLSGHSLSDETFAPYVVEQLRQAGKLNIRIGFEITETAAIANLSRAMLFMNTLKALGCSFALDDFGSGMSSFAYLKNLPVDKIKIDGIFVRDILTDKIDYAMVEAITRVGHEMGIETVAEFVESTAVLEQLKRIGVAYAQGYGIHVPDVLDAVLNPSAIRVRQA